MKRMLDWLSYLLWTSEAVFLAASTPHIATYFYHFDNPTDIWGQVYSWLVAYGLALTIDGVSFVILMSLVVAITHKRGGWLIAFLVFALLVISGLSWFINWQYDITFSSSMFAKADAIKTINGWTIGSLNPLIGGAFPLMAPLYALVAKALEVDESSLTKKAMTTEQFENEKRRLQQENELKSLKASQWNGKGLLSVAKERLIGVQSQDNEEPMIETEIVNEEPMMDDIADSVVSLDSFSSARNVPLEYACQLLECDTKTVKQLISKGKLKTPSNSLTKVTRSSIDEYLASKRRKRVQSQDNAVAMPVIESSNGHAMGDTDPLGMPALTV